MSEEKSSNVLKYILSFIRRMCKIVKESFGDKTRDSACVSWQQEIMYAYLRDNLGIDAEMVSNETPEDIGSAGYIGSAISRKRGIRVFLPDYKDLGSIKIRGKNIDLIQITEYDDYEWRGDVYYDFDYAIKVDRADIEGKEKRLEAKTKITKKKGIFRKTVYDFEWRGGELSELLNADRRIWKTIIEEQLLRFHGISTKIDKRKGKNKVSTVRIRHRSRVVEYPSERLFECYEMIAGHIREVLYSN